MLHELEKLKDDDLRAKFVASITDKEMKLSLLSYIQKRENRDLIINSFDRKVDEEIKDVKYWVLQIFLKEILRCPRK